MDAIALDKANTVSELKALLDIRSPLSIGSSFKLDENGLAIATKVGALAPAGHQVFSGNPEVVPPIKPVPNYLSELNNSIKDFKGNYSKYIVFRESEIDRQIKHKKNQDKYIKQANLLIDKFKYKKNKATFAQTLIRRLEKMDKIEVDEVDVTSINFQFPEPLHCGKIIFQLNDIQKKFGDKIIFNDLNLDVYKGDKIAFVGQNGCGKTTLTKIISG